MTKMQSCVEPHVQQIRNFCALKDGSHIPGYVGFCPQIKFRYGKTYGKLTHEIAQDSARYNKQSSSQKQNVSESLSNLQDVSKTNLPISKGTNKYTEAMVPGYSGYIPHYEFNFGETYRKTCDKCIGEFVEDYEQKLSTKQKPNNLFSSLKPVNGTEATRDHLNSWCDKTLQDRLSQTSRKHPLEAARPGYSAFVPRINVTELGLGIRYSVTSLRGYRDFYGSMPSQRKELKEKLATLDSLPSSSTSKQASNSRLYTNCGMLPNYTGYVPESRFAFGHTFGESTRLLDACSHKMQSYGEYLRNQCSVT